MGDDVWNTLLSELNTLDLAELEGGLLIRDAVDCETSLGIVDETEVLVGLLEGDDIHESGWVCWVGSDLSVDLDEALHKDGLDLTSVESVLQSAHQPIRPQIPPFFVEFSVKLACCGGTRPKANIRGACEDLGMVVGRTIPTICREASEMGRRAASCAFLDHYFTVSAFLFLPIHFRPSISNIPNHFECLAAWVCFWRRFRGFVVWGRRAANCQCSSPTSRSQNSKFCVE